MASLSREQLATLVRGISLRQIRLASGTVLFAYLVSHFLNHALGNISMGALASGVYLHTLFWQSLPVTIVFYTACLVHTALGVWALYERRQFRWKAIEPLQLVLGLSIPALIITHMVGVRLGHTLFGHENLYPQVFLRTGSRGRRKWDDVRRAGDLLTQAAGLYSGCGCGRSTEPRRSCLLPRC